MEWWDVNPGSDICPLTDAKTFRSEAMARGKIVGRF